MDLIRAGNAGRRGWAWAVLLTLVFVMGVLSGCGKQGPDIDLADIDISELQAEKTEDFHILFRKMKPAVL